MKIAVYSDLHIEFGEFVPPAMEIDLVILAGDIHVKTGGIDWAAKCFPDTRVLYVPGNHEYYREAYPKLMDKLRAKAALHSNITVLDQHHVEIDGVHFLGTTLWTDFDLFGDPHHSGHYAEVFMTDYKLIRSSPQFRKLRATDTLRSHRASKAWLETTLASLGGERIVVVTHHAPSIKSVPDGYLRDPASPAYASHLDDLILKYQPEFWIHGHMHDSLRYQIGSTTVICNPRGYAPDDLNEDFDPGMVLTL